MIDNKKLKELIKTNTLSEDPLILLYQDNPFVCRQYANEISKNRQLEKIRINKLSEVTFDDDFFGSEASALYIYETEKLEENLTEEFKNVIVICKKVTANISKDIVQVKIDKLLPWQIEDYVKARVPGLTDAQVKWLCDISKYNIYRLEKEADKLSIFSEEIQQILFNQMNDENVYCDLNNLTIFNFITAIVNKDYQTVMGVLENIRWIDIEPTGVVTLLLKQFKILLEVAFSNVWNNTMTCSEKQFYYFKRNMMHLYSRERLIDIYEFLTSIDQKLKSGYVPNDLLIDYIINNIIRK